LVARLFFYKETAPGDSRCALCIARPPPFARARAALLYDDGCRGLILSFKHGDRTDLAPVFARWLARAGAELLGDADLLVPVPLHRWRLFHRRYNQSALLARLLARTSGVPMLPDLLIRHRATPSQGGLGRRGRVRNVAGAFALHSRLARRADGRRVLLIDDVHTTGATLGECARLLRRAGAARVDVLTLARVAGLDS
jgi:ComF family protein